MHATLCVHCVMAGVGRPIWLPHNMTRLWTPPPPQLRTMMSFTRLAACASPVASGLRLAPFRFGVGRATSMAWPARAMSSGAEPAGDADGVAGADDAELVPALPPCEPGCLFVWGTGDMGQLGRGEAPSSPLGKYQELFPKQLEVVDGDGAPMKWTQVSCGASTTAAVAADGSLYTWGKCPYFSLGHGEDVEQCNVPTKVEALDGIPIVGVDAGEYHCAAVSEEGDVYTWGWGGSFMSGTGGLGHGDHVSQPRPALVEALCDAGVAVQSVSCGQRHTLALSREGQVFSWGNGEFGRLGNGKQSQKAPEVVDALEGTVCRQVCAGQAYSMAVCADGNLYGWGRNDQAQLGLGASITMDMNTMESFPTLLESLSGQVAQVSCGKAHTIALDKDGNLYYWGSRNFLEPKRLSTLPAVGVQVSAGDGTSAVITDSGAVFTWGKGFMSGTLGHGEKKGLKHPKQMEMFQAVPLASVSMGHGHSAAISA